MSLFIIYPAQDHSELDFFFFMKICPVPVIVVEDSKKMVDFPISSSKSEPLSTI